MTTIRGRLLAMLLIGLAIVLTAGGAAVYWIARAGLARQLDDGLRTRALALGSLVTFDDGRIEFEFDRGQSGTIADAHFEFRNRAGDVLRRSRSLGATALPVRTPGENEPVFADLELPGAVPGRVVWMAFRPRVDSGYAQELAAHGGELEVLIVGTGVDRRPVDRALATLLGALIGVGGVVAVTVGVLITLGVRWGLAPLDRLSGQLAGVSGPTISRRFDDGGAPRELVPVHRELNRMLDRVERTLDRERSFVDAAAHELRTPLTELRTTAEVALRWPDGERAEAALREVLAVGRDMERLVESLLLISRGSATAAEGGTDEVPMAAIVRECLTRTTGSIRNRELSLTVEVEERPTLRAPRSAVEIIVRNLIDNAVQYTPPRGSITIRSGPTTNGSTSLIVENGPVGLTEDDLPRLFEPFWRTDGARSDREHVGLGLTVVDQIAHAIGLRVQAGLAGDRLQLSLSTPA